jgi:hypothetical protein
MQRCHSPSYPHTRILNLHWSYPGNRFQHSNYASLTETAAHMNFSLQSRISFLPFLHSRSTVIAQYSHKYSSAGLGSSLHGLGSAPTENTVSIVIAQQYLDCCFFQQLSCYIEWAIPVTQHRSDLWRQNTDIDGVWIGNRIYWTIYRTTRHYRIHSHTQISFLSLLQIPIVVVWWRLPTVDFPLPLGSLTVPMHQLPPYNSNSSQGLNRSSSLTNSPTNSSLTNCVDWLNPRLVLFIIFYFAVVV